MNKLFSKTKPYLSYPLSKQRIAISCVIFLGLATMIHLFIPVGFIATFSKIIFCYLSLFYLLLFFKRYAILQLPIRVFALPFVILEEFDPYFYAGMSLLIMLTVMGMISIAIPLRLIPIFNTVSLPTLVTLYFLMTSFAILTTRYGDKLIHLHQYFTAQNLRNSVTEIALRHGGKDIRQCIIYFIYFILTIYLYTKPILSGPWLDHDLSSAVLASLSTFIAYERFDAKHSSIREKKRERTKAR